MLRVQQQGSDGWLGGGKSTSWRRHVSTAQHYSGTIFLSHPNFQFPTARNLFVSRKQNKGKAPEQDSHKTHTIPHSTDITKDPAESQGLQNISVEFSKVKGRAASSFSLSCWLQSNAWNTLTNPNLNILCSTVQSIYWKSIIHPALLSGTQGPAHCPRETSPLTSPYPGTVYCTASAFYSFHNSAAMVKIRLIVKPSDSVFNSWVLFWSKSSSFLKK